MKKVLVMWPPQLMFYGSVFRHFTFVGETIDYICKNVNAEVEYIDCGIEMFSLKEIQNYFKNSTYLVIYGETYTIESCRKMAKLAKQVNPKIKIIGFGRAFCYMPKYFLKNNYDAVVTNGFWEKSIVDFINENTADDCGEILTLEGRKGKPYQLLPDEWGVPRLDKIPYKKYFEITKKKQLEICVNKGCPYNCSFCSEKFVYGRKEGRRSPDNLIKFIESSHNLCDTYFFDATTFTFDKKWVKEVCEKIKALPYKIKWCTTTRLDELSEDLIKMMSEAGCFRLSVGVETLNKDIQKNIHKEINYNNMIDLFNLLKKYNIKPRALLICGLPGQTKSELLNTYQNVKEMGLDFRFKEYAPYNEILKDGVSKEIIDRFDRTEYMSDDIDVKDLPSDQYMELLFADTGR